MALALPVVCLPTTDKDTGKASATHNNRSCQLAATGLPDTRGQNQWHTGISGNTEALALGGLLQ